MKASCVYKKAGQSLTEYSFALLLLLLGVVAALTSLGGVLGQGFSGMMVWNIGGDASIPASGNPSFSLAENPSSLSQSGGVQLKLSDGTILRLPGVPTNMNSLVEAAGGNGATQRLADSLAELAKLLLSKEKITPEQASSLIALANQGHRIAKIEALLEEASAQAGGDYSKFQTGQLEFEGQRKSVVDWAWELNLTQITPADFPDNPQVVLNNPTLAWHGKEMIEFLRLYQRLGANGSLTEPAVKQTVEALSTEIVYLSEATAHTSVNSDKYGQALINKGDSPLSSGVASYATHADSFGICSVGNGKDSGVQCFN